MYTTASLPARCGVTRTFRHVFNIEHLFHLTSHTTFNEYAYAVRLGRVNGERLLPPEFPYITLRFASNTAQTKSHHLPCPGHGVWNTKMTSKFRSHEAAIRTLSVWTERFWCSHCSRGLFFPPACADHPNT